MEFNQVSTELFCLGCHNYIANAVGSDDGVTYTPNASEHLPVVEVIDSSAASTNSIVSITSQQPHALINAEEDVSVQSLNEDLSTPASVVAQSSVFEEVFAQPRTDSNNIFACPQGFLY